MKGKQFIFWINHPSPFVSMYMKYDWFKMNDQDFVIKYLNEYFDSKLPEKKEAIINALKHVWAGFDSEKKYNVLVDWSNKHSVKGVEGYYLVLHLSEKFDCGFLSNAAEILYGMITKRNYSTNYFSAMGLLSSKKSSRESW